LKKQVSKDKIENNNEKNYKIIIDDK